MSGIVEYRVRPITRFVVTRWHQETKDGVHHGSCEECGEFPNHASAVKIAEALVCREAIGGDAHPIRNEDSWTIGALLDGEPGVPA